MSNDSGFDDEASWRERSSRDNGDMFAIGIGDFDHLITRPPAAIAAKQQLHPRDRQRLEDEALMVQDVDADDDAANYEIANHNTLASSKKMALPAATPPRMAHLPHVCKDHDDVAGGDPWLTSSEDIVLVRTDAALTSGDAKTHEKKQQALKSLDAFHSITFNHRFATNVPQTVTETQTSPDRTQQQFLQRRHHLLAVLKRALANYRALSHLIPLEILAMQRAADRRSKEETLLPRELALMYQGLLSAELQFVQAWAAVSKAPRVGGRPHHGK
jgi:hypothetical protein